MPRVPKPENYLRGAELAMEQNYDEIDGILDNVDTVHAGGTERMMKKRTCPRRKREKHTGISNDRRKTLWLKWMKSTA